MTVEQRSYTQKVAAGLSISAIWQTAVVLFKLRVVFLLLLSAYGGAMLAALATGQSTWSSWFMLSIAGTLSAAGASGINQYLERERDKQMGRTAKRPLPAGMIERPITILWLSIAMVIVAIIMAALINGPTAVFVTLGALIYVGVYTVWLKPRTILNIIIGGAAGSCAVLSGGAAMGAWSATAVLLLALLIFAWTPVHFWALALAYRDDYRQAGFPMLPAQVTPHQTAWWTALHTFLTVLCGVAIGFVPTIDWFYLLPIVALSILLLDKTRQLILKPERANAFTLFHYSNIYLAAVLAVILLAPIWR